MSGRPLAIVLRSGAGPLAVLVLAACTPPRPEVVLRLPVDCTLGEDCWFSSRPDRDPGSPGIRDHAGGTHTYDGHEGADLALADAGHARYTWVLAPAPGRVEGFRDEEPDGELAAGGPDAVEGRECGNGVRLDLGEGWIAQLCHLHRGTVAVSVGDRVRAGDRLGRVGWSGEADCPHVHLTVWRDDRRVDPFDGQYLDDGSPAAFAPLWETPVPAPGAVDALAWVGFESQANRAASEASEVSEVGPSVGRDPMWPYDAGRAVIPAEAGALVLGAFLWRPEAGDVVTTEITTPAGVTTSARWVQPRSRPRETVWVDKDWPADARPTGLWTARVEWRRGDQSRVMHTSAVLR